MRRPRGWTRFGEEGAVGLDLPDRRARELALAQGWRAVAGERLAERVVAEGVRHGILELTTAGKAWRDAVLPALPALAARLASLHPQLGVRKVRLRLEGESELPPALAVPAAPPRARAAAAPAAIPPRPGLPEEPDDAPAEIRLMRLAGRYLERRARRVD